MTSLPRRRAVGLLFPGQGAQHAAMAAGLYMWEPAFTAAMDEFFDALGAGGARLRSDWLGLSRDLPIDDIRRSQPLLLAVGHALGRMVMSWGVSPEALLGHSVGELAAATLAGVFELADAARLVQQRTETFARTPPGGMLAVAGSAHDLEPLLTGAVVVGAVNGPQQTLLAGPESDLLRVESDLRELGFACLRARSTAAFHSPVVADAAAATGPAVAALRLSPPGLPVYSSQTGRRLLPEEATDPRFWARQPAARVLFGPALDLLLAGQDLLLLEAGPSQGLAALARRHPAVAAGRSAVMALLPARPRGAIEDRRAILAAVECIQAEGHRVAAPESAG